MKIIRYLEPSLNPALPLLPTLQERPAWNLLSRNGPIRMKKKMGKKRSAPSLQRIKRLMFFVFPSGVSNRKRRGKNDSGVTIFLFFFYDAEGKRGIDDRAASFGTTEIVPFALYSRSFHVFLIDAIFQRSGDGPNERKKATGFDFAPGFKIKLGRLQVALG
ncbi:hypothetical protein TNCV_2550001 [Trichonephila clavipes]|nr:hypothetical protein TNCV_2550001 [Trichonephila clavipes]